MNYCDECKHFIPNKDDPKYARCRITILKREPISLRYISKVFDVPPEEEYYFCHVVRTSQVDTHCGPDGRFFQAEVKPA